MSARTRIASQIRMTLARSGWSAAELARKAGVSPSTITRVLDDDGRFTPSTRTLERLAPHLLTEPPSVTSDGGRDRPQEEFQPASRPGGSDETGRRQMPENPVLTVSNGRVTLNLTATVSPATASKILALIAEDQE